MQPTPASRPRSELPGGPIRPLRVATRGARFSLTLAGCALTLASLRRKHTGLPPRPVRARWMSSRSSRFVQSLGITVEPSGPIPTRGIVLSNHLGYADIVVLGSLMPAVFVSKADVRQWPIFGWLVEGAGTLFVDRERRQDVNRTNGEISAAVQEGSPIIVFPEGTSSPGDTVLEFRSSLLQPAMDPASPLTAAAIHYEVDEGIAEQDVCWWGDMTLANHLPRLLSRTRIRARVAFSPYEGDRVDRKQLARDLHARVLSLKHGLAAQTQRHAASR